MVTIKRISYGHDSSLEAGGQAGFFLNCYYSKGGLVMLDIEREYASKQEFLTAVEEVIPIFEDDKQDDEVGGCGGCGKE